jgi:hypothetical protein
MYGNRFLLILESDTFFKVYHINEYDHWFPVSHKISIDIKNGEFVIDRSRLNMGLEMEDKETYIKYKNQYF